MKSLATISGIELGTDSCVLVRTRQVGAATEVSALHAVYAAEWPSQDVALAALLRRIRRDERFPRRARVVGWQMPDSASPSDPATRAALRPLVAAGFRVDALVSPPQALALLAATRPGRGDAAAAWLALNRHGVAIAIVRGTELLFSRAFEWSYRGRAGASTNAQLLERYSLVAHLAPELRHGMDLVRANYGADVDSVITCGDLPDLRSLTMPLIEELDLEVETLDSTDGLLLTPSARAQRGAELAPALRLACAAAARARSERPGIPASLKAAAAAVILIGGGALAYSRWPARQPPVGATPTPRVTTQTPAAGRSGTANRPLASASRQSAPQQQPQSQQTQQSPLRESAPEPRRASQPAAGPVRPALPPSHQDTRPAPKTAPPQPSRADAPKPTAPKPDATRPAVPAATATPQPTRPAPKPASPTPEAKQAPRVAAQPMPQKPAPPKVDEPAADTKRAQEPPALPRPRPLNAPVPSVSSILISSDRRLAVIDGKIVAVGDQVGPRIVARIEPSYVVLREPSGFELRAPLR